MSTQLSSLSKQIFQNTAKSKASDLFFRTQPKNTLVRKKSSVDDFHHEIFNIVEKNIRDGNRRNTRALTVNSESLGMNSSENLFRERAEEVLEGNTYNNEPYSAKEQKQKDLKDLSHMIKKSSGAREPKKGNINRVKISKLKTRDKINLLDKHYLEDTVRMVQFLRFKGVKKGFSGQNPRSGIFKPWYCSVKMKTRLERYVIKKVWAKTGKKKEPLGIEVKKMKCLFEITQNLNLMIQKKQVTNMLICLDLFLDILGKNEYYYLTRKGMLISMKIFFTLEELDKCSEITLSLLRLANLEQDYSCLVAGWMRLAECHSKKSEFPQALEAYFQVLKFAIISDDLNSELKAYDKIGVVYFNLGKMTEAKFFHRKGLEVNYRSNKRDLRSKQQAKTILTSLFETGNCRDFELILDDFLQQHQLFEERRNWKREASLVLNERQEMDLIQFLFNFPLAMKGYDYQVGSREYLKSKENNQFEFNRDTDRSLRACGKLHLFDSESEREEPSLPSSLREQEKKREMELLKEMNCTCSALLFYEKKCEYCLSLERPKSKKRNLERSTDSRLRDRFLNEKLKKKMAQLKSKFGFETVTDSKRSTTNPKILNKYGESYFVAKDNHIQKKKVNLM